MRLILKPTVRDLDHAAARPDTQRLSVLSSSRGAGPGSREAIPQAIASPRRNGNGPAGRCGREATNGWTAINGFEAINRHLWIDR